MAADGYRDTGGWFATLDAAPLYGDATRLLATKIRRRSHWLAGKTSKLLGTGCCVFTCARSVRQCVLKLSAITAASGLLDTLKTQTVHGLQGPSVLARQAQGVLRSGNVQPERQVLGHINKAIIKAMPSAATRGRAFLPRRHKRLIISRIYMFLWCL